jgi:hypothetical protein
VVRRWSVGGQKVVSRWSERARVALPFGHRLHSSDVGLRERKSEREKEGEGESGSPCPWAIASIAGACEQARARAPVCHIRHTFPSLKSTPPSEPSVAPPAPREKPPPPPLQPPPQRAAPRAVRTCPHDLRHHHCCVQSVCDARNGAYDLWRRSRPTPN